MPSFQFLHLEERKASTIEYDDGESCTFILVMICLLPQMTAVAALILSHAEFTSAGEGEHGKLLNVNNASI